MSHCFGERSLTGQSWVPVVDCVWNMRAHGDAREGKWGGNWRMEWAASSLHTTSEHVVSSITTADAHTSAASSGLNWSPCRFNPLNAEFNPIFHLLALLGAHHILHVSRIRVKWTRPFRRKTKSGFCACTITFSAVSHCFVEPAAVPSIWQKLHKTSRQISHCTSKFILSRSRKRSLMKQYADVHCRLQYTF